MSKIKLHQLDELPDGTKRFQSQLYIGRTSIADFIMGTDNIMKCYAYGNKGFDFYPYTEPYEIAENISDMNFQAL